MLGGLECTDGMPETRDDCSLAHRYCAPQDLCMRCNDPNPRKAFSSCAIAPPLNPMVTGITCRLPNIMDPANGRIVCPSRPSFVLPFQAGGALTCSGATFHGQAPGDTWTTALDLGGAPYLLTAMAGSGCSIAFTLQGQPAQPSQASGLPYAGLVAVDMTAAGGVVVPITFELNDVGASCSAAPTPVICTSNLVTTDSIYKCNEAALP